MYETINAKGDYVIVAPGLILSEHSTAAEARRGLHAALAEGFSGASILMRTPRGWKEFDEQQSKVKSCGGIPKCD